VILAIESSCDESAVALFDPERGIVGEWIHSQVALHERHGGVVPDLATREHLRHLGTLLERAQKQAEFSSITEVAVTLGPGLAACLAVGGAAAKALALARHVPLVGVNHLRAHAWSPFIAIHAASPAEFAKRRQALLPHLGLIVSGGNTLLFGIDEHGGIAVLASTKDDAAGEALDKGAKLLGLGYPGGPLIEKFAVGGRADAFDFPRGNGPRSDLDFSFSGLKTSLRYRLEKMALDEVAGCLPDLCASYQQAVIDSLLRKTRAALGQRRWCSLGLSGGVANNGVLRRAMAAVAAKAGVEFLAAKPIHAGDNAGMIGFAAWADAQGAQRTAGFDLKVEPNAPLA
jgi:N6-L-threonylcarbamoyladenine synthase